MKISKIFAGLSAAAIMASMAAAVPASAKEISLYNAGWNIQVGHMKNAHVTIKVTSSTNNIWNGEEGVSEGYMYTVQKSWNADAPADDVAGEVPFTENTMKGATYLNDWDSGPTKFNGQWAQITLTDDDLSALTFEVTVECGSDAKWEYHPYDPDKAENENVYIIFRMGAEGNLVMPSSGQAMDIDGWNCVVSSDEINSQFGGKTSTAEATDESVTENGYYNATYSGTFTYAGSDIASTSPEVTEWTYDDGKEDETSKADESKADESKSDTSSTSGGSGDSNSKADTSSAAADGSSASDTSSAADTVDAGSTDTANAGNSDSSSSSTAAASASSSSSTAAASADSKSSTSSTAASATKSSTTTTTSSSAAAPAGGGSDGSAESDATSNAASGAAADVGLAITAVAAAAIVVSKRRD